MKQFYPFATILLSILSLSLLTSAQTYSGGVYTAQRNGSWHVNSGPNVWDPSGEPPAHCSNCLITINSGVTVSLNINVTLDQGSILQIGTDNSAASELYIPASSGTDWASSNNVILVNDGTSSSIQLINSSAFINAADANHQFDGVFTTAGTTPVTYFRQVGTGPSSYQGTTIVNNRAFSNNTQTGAIALSSNGTLPVSLVDLAAVLTDGKVNITWTTLIEANSNFFSVLRSTDGGASWKSIGTVAAKGNSSVAVNYSFTDETPGAGVSEYRLEAFDKDGKSAITPVVVVRNGQLGNVSFFPNPAKDFVYISIPEATTGNLSVRLFSQTGQLLTEKSVSNAGGTTISLPVSNYPQGNYVLIVSTTDGAKQVNKLMISK